MMNEDPSLEDIKRRQEFEELKNYLKTLNSTSEHVMTATWRFIKHMQSDLNLPSQTPMGELVELFNNLEEIRKFFNLKISSFTQLNELFYEIKTLKEKLNLPDDSSITDILSRISPESIPFLGLGENSLLKRLLILFL